MTWTRDKPTVPGWYWRRVCGDTFTEKLVSGHLGVYPEREGKIHYGDKLTGEWAGPIVPPEK